MSSKDEFIAAIQAKDYLKAVNINLEVYEEVCHKGEENTKQGLTVQLSLAQTCLLCYQNDCELKETALVWAVQHGTQAIRALRKLFPNSYELMLASITVGRAIISDQQETLLAAFPPVTIQELYREALKHLDTAMIVGQHLLDDPQLSKELKDHIEEILKSVRIDVNSILPKSAQYKEVEAKCFYIEDLKEWVTVYVEHGTGKIFFNGDDVCRICGITKEEADNLLKNHPEDFCNRVYITNTRR